MTRGQTQLERALMHARGRLRAELKEQFGPGIRVEIKITMRDGRVFLDDDSYFTLPEPRS